MKKRLITAMMVILAGSSVVVAQRFKVDAIKAVATGAPGGVYHPVFTPDGKSLLLTGEDFSGLAALNLETQDYTILTTMEGAGYKTAFSDDGTTVIVRQNHLDTQLMDIYAIDMGNARAMKVESGLEHTNSISFNKGSLNFAQKGKIRSRGLATRKYAAAKKAMPDEIFVNEEDLKIAVYRNGARSVVDPLSTPGNDVNYCWTELSPDKKHIVFVAGRSAYTCNLDGSGLVNIGALRAPKWKDNDFIVGMNDSDDGHRFTKSDIVIVHRDGSDYQQLTASGNEIKMFPAVSPDGKRIAFNTTEGKVYIMSVSEK